MNRRKLLLGIVGVAGVAGSAGVGPDVGLDIELSRDLFMLDVEGFRNLAKLRKIRWVRSTDLYTTMRKGWKEHPWHITRFAGDEMSHLMVIDG